MLIASVNPGARGNHLTSQVSWSAASLLVTHVCLVYLVEGLLIVFLFLLKQKVAAILGNGCGVQGQNFVAWFQGSKMLVTGW